MSKELQALEGIVFYLNASNEPKSHYFKKIEIIKTALKEHEVMKQTKFIVSINKFSDADLDKLKNQRMISNLEPCEIKPLFDEETQKKLKAFEIIKEKEVDVRGINVSSAANEYNNWFSKRLKNDLTQEEYDLLKEVLQCQQ
jgi:hypothetical protein